MCRQPRLQFLAHQPVPALQFAHRLCLKVQGIACAAVAVRHYAHQLRPRHYARSQCLRQKISPHPIQKLPRGSIVHLKCRVIYYHNPSAKIVQIERRTASLLDCYAEMQTILSKDSANRAQNAKPIRMSCRRRWLFCVKVHASEPPAASAAWTRDATKVRASEMVPRGQCQQSHTVSPHTPNPPHKNDTKSSSNRLIIFNQIYLFCKKNTIYLSDAKNHHTDIQQLNIIINH